MQAWCRHVRRVIYVEKSITWNDVPGYKEIVTAILEEVQEANLLYIRDSMVAALRSFVVNPKLLNAVIKLIFRKTSIYNSVSVLKAMDLTSTMFLQIYHKEL